MVLGNETRLSARDDLPLVCNTQAYLAVRLAQLAPNSVLALAWEQFYGVYDRVLRGFAPS